MRRLINHVRSKPDHIRELTAIGCTAVVGLVIVAFWFHSFQTTTYALLNGPDTTSHSDNIAATDNSGSLFSSIGDTISGIKGQISDIFKKNSNKTDTTVQTDNSSDDGAVYPLPVQ